ncbi:MAG TPA: glycoside hydrolase family 20 zincin-like fold domain-containing protein [Phycisphaerae bacterium]|nr:glycoside hydrolase family 20 zincin-like fold domain-containing protein [Phycisphaerae bacterium]
MPTLHLLPHPKSLTLAKGRFTLPAQMFILLHPDPATRDLFAAERFEIEAESLSATAFQIAVTTESTDPAAEIRVLPDPSLPHDQAYRLTIAPASITLHARTPAGTFYAFQTLLQILRESAYSALPGKRTTRPNRQSAMSNRQSPLKLPALTILDHPDFPRRGVYLDTARGKVPTVDTLLQLIDDLAHLKINEFQLYIENNFQFRKHPQMFDDTTPFTAEEILLLDAACRARHIDFVPSLTSLGHFEKILRRPAFRHLAEAEPDELKKQGIATWSEDPWSLNVTDPASKQLLTDMYAEFLPNFSSPTVNICCDESWDLGKGRSKPAADALGGDAGKGTTKLYVQWINFCNSLASSHRKRIQMWADIILHHPEFIPDLPEDATLLEWGYESHHAFDDHCKTIAERLKGSARSFYVAPGTASWLSFAARTRNALGNIHNAATAGLKHGAAGLLLTDWGDHGHQQLLAVSLLPFAYSAAASWNLAATPNPAPKQPPDWSTGAAPRAPKSLDTALRPFLAAASLHLFHDPAASFAALPYDLGLTYERFSWQRFNGSLDWFLFREKFDFANYVNRASDKDLHAVIAATQSLLPKIAAATFNHPHADLLKAELAFTAEEIIHTCRRTLLRQQWLAADPATRNPEHETLRKKPPIPLPKNFPQQLRTLSKNAATLATQYRTLWLARNKPSRLDDILTEFQRLQQEYKHFAAK